MPINGQKLMTLGLPIDTKLWTSRKKVIPREMKNSYSKYNNENNTGNDVQNVISTGTYYNYITTIH